MKLEYEVKLNHTEISMIRWMCGVKLNDRKVKRELFRIGTRQFDNQEE